MDALEYRGNLENLIKETPGVPIIPVVDKEPGMYISGQYWIGSLGESYIRKYAEIEGYYIFENDEEAVNIKKEDWKKAIFINIEKL